MLPAAPIVALWDATPDFVKRALVAAALSAAMYAAGFVHGLTHEKAAERAREVEVRIKEVVRTERINAADDQLRRAYRAGLAWRKNKLQQQQETINAELAASNTGTVCRYPRNVRLQLNEAITNAASTSGSAGLLPEFGNH